MKGHMEKDGFHPHKTYKGVRKSRDQQDKTKGTKIRKARNQDLVYAESYNMGQNIKVVGHGNDWMLLVDRNVVGRATTQKEIFEMYDKVNVHPETGSTRFFDPRSPRSFKERKVRDDEAVITDEQSHDIQNRIDLVMDKTKDEKLLKELEDIRDSIPCSCDRRKKRELSFKTSFPLSKAMRMAIVEGLNTNDFVVLDQNKRWKLTHIVVDSGAEFYVFPDEDSAIEFGRQSIRDTATEYIPDKGTPQYDEYKNLDEDELVEKIIQEQSDFGQRSELGAIAQSVAGYDGQYSELSDGSIAFQIS